MQLTPNFAADEFDVNEPWPLDKQGNRQALADLFQWLRDLCGRPIIITSAFRSPAHNASVGGSSTSQHLTAEAADGTVVGMTNREVARRVLAAKAAGEAPDYGQFIVYDDDGHVHLSLGSKQQDLVAARDDNGARTYRPLVVATDVARLGASTVTGLVVVAVLLAVAGVLIAWSARHGGV
jgi:zinc D-Ala-D-Ala carboxypeptidase